MPTVVHWFRRDLRVTDNTALHAAWTQGARLVPVFIWDDAILRSPEVGPARVGFLLRSLASLARNLESLGHRLIVRRGPPAEVLVNLARETQATAIHTNRDYEPYATARDQSVAQALASVGVEFVAHKDAVIWERREILTLAGDPYTVFTPYARAWRARPIPSPVPRIGPPKTPVVADLATLPLPDDPAGLGHPLSQDLFPAGEHAGQEVLRRFVQARLHTYHTARNHPADDTGTSRLSAHLRFGTVNIRTVLARWQTAMKDIPPAARRGGETWQSELIWREFYLQILANYPRVASGNFRPEYDALEWSGTDEQFAAWCAGDTGYPIVDAAMRCLRATGWMHNRLRMIVAMFLTKDLLISWQRGERHFMRELVDGDLAANNGGWQWSAGTGTDAAPYFRIFNPVTQGQKFDPDGTFVRRWVPELRDLDADAIHCPWENPLLLARTGYRPPIVDHAVQRQKCLAMFKAVRG